MKKIVLIAFISCFAFASFAQKTMKIKKGKEYVSESGLKYTIYKINKKAAKADSGDYVSVHYVGKLADGTVFDSSYDRKQPIDFQLGIGRVIKGWDEGLKYLHIGDSALFEIPPAIAYGERAVGKIPVNSTLFFTVKLVNVKKAVKPYDVTKKDTVHLDNGLSYIIVKKGKGKKLVSGDKAFVNYTGYFSDGKIFDSSFDKNRKVFDVIIGRNRVIKGWELGLVGMKAGEKRRLNIPYHLAYGEKGKGMMPPKSDLVFDVVLEKFEKINYPEFDLEGKDTLSLPTGVKYIIAESTEGLKVEPNDSLVIQYVGRFMDETIFDSSYDRSDSLIFQAAKGSVIKGLDEGLMFIRKGMKVRFIIPYKLAYGESGRPPVIPEKADLIFDIYLQDVKKTK